MLIVKVLWLLGAGLETGFYLPSHLFFFLSGKGNHIDLTLSFFLPFSLKCFQGSLVLLSPGTALTGPSLH